MSVVAYALLAIGTAQEHEHEWPACDSYVAALEWSMSHARYCMVVARHIVIAEHDDDVRALLEQVVLHTYPFATIASVADGVAALGTFRQQGAKLVLIDAELPLQTGLDVVRELRSYDATVPIIVLSVDDTVAEQAHSIGATCFVAKPFGMREMMQTLLEVLPLEQAHEG